MPSAARTRQTAMPSPTIAIQATGAAATLTLPVTGKRHTPLHVLLPILSSAGLLVESEHETPTSQTLQCTLPHDLADSLHDADTRTHLAQLITCALGGSQMVSGLNRLVLSAGLTLPELATIRAYAAWAVQMDGLLTWADITRVLTSNASGTLALTLLIKARLQPDWPTAKGTPTRSSLEATSEKTLRDVQTATTTAADERVWKTLHSLVSHTLRTNLYSRAHEDEPLAFKLDSATCPVVPQPRPWREIFVYGGTVEGIHLRGGAIARGGLRHSSRTADYRTEVLGLMTAQMRKNTIITPTGAKGGFIVKHGEAASAYRSFVRALLSVTDTLQNAKPVPPVGVRCLDAADPYLVVAADKGTASFSDFGNAESAAADFWNLKTKGFWLGDAFASGGSHGYDHKAMGITAKGAWLSVLHHLAAQGIAPGAKRPITVVGIGDMGGDVFGNGLLRSPHIKLLAAFNHKHIFIDPNPDCASSFNERKRCFDKGLDWDGYATKTLSKGGGMYLRSAKTITLSAAAQTALGLKKDTLTPDELISAILCAEVDVLWNGGIGTYIKADTETHAAAADKTNDAVRVNASAVKARVVGEGGNLGITPRGRIQLALQGVGLNSDALDNSGGVNTSDLEVNLKIALNSTTKPLSFAARNTLLHKLTPDVEHAVLATSLRQNWAITLEQAGTAADHAGLFAWQKTLVRRGVVDEDIDCLPTRNELAERKPLSAYTRPELASLLAGTKATLKAGLLMPEAADILTSAPVQRLFTAYFPQAVHTVCGSHLAAHPLADNIKATLLANMLVDYLGIGFGAHLAADFAVTPHDVVRAALVALELLGMPKLWGEIEAAGLATPARIKTMLRTRQVVASLAAWVLGRGAGVNIAKLLNEFGTPMAALAPKAVGLLPAASATEAARWHTEWQALGCPRPLASALCALSPLSVVPDAVRIAAKAHVPLEATLKLHLAVGEMLQIPRLIRTSRAIDTTESWTRMAVQSSVQEFFIRQSGLTKHLLRSGQTLSSWQKNTAAPLARYRSFAENVVASPNPSVAMLAVLVARLRELEA